MILAPFDVALADDTVSQSDLLVAPRTDLTARDLPVAPLLAVEVLSPSTRRYDLTLKRDRFQAAGVAAYWVIDPAEPRLRVWEQRADTYEEVADVSGDEPFTASVPFGVIVTPARLLR